VTAAGKPSAEQLAHIDAPDPQMARLFAEAIAPNTERIGSIGMRGDVTVVVHAPEGELVELAHFLGWDGAQPAFRLSNAKRKVFADNIEKTGDANLARWLRRSDVRGDFRLFAISGAAGRSRRPDGGEVRRPASGIRHPASGIRHPASGIRHPASGIRHPASGISPTRRLRPDGCDDGDYDPTVRTRTPSSPSTSISSPVPTRLPFTIRSNGPASGRSREITWPAASSTSDASDSRVVPIVTVSSACASSGSAMSRTR
jgi:hypothetical protein